MKAAEMVGLTSSAFKDYEDVYAKIKELRSVFNKQLALDAKIEKVENDLKIREDLTKRRLQDQLQRALEKKLNKVRSIQLFTLYQHLKLRLCQATKSEIGWRNRYKYSSLVELQGNWEYRRDDRTGLKFFHSIISPNTQKEKFAETCQWEVPVDWDGDLWRPQLVNAKGAIGAAQMKPDKLGSIKSSLQDDASSFARLTVNDEPFAEPLNTWAPTLPKTKGDTMQIHVTNNISHIPNSSRSINSIEADKSLAESIAPTIDTVNLEHIAEQLLSSDEVMRVLAKRLGLPEAQIVPADELSSVFSIQSNNFGGNFYESEGKRIEDVRLEAPRDKDADDLEEAEFNSDDELWSDDEHEVGDFDAEEELSADLPQNQLEATALRRREQFAAKSADSVSVPSKVPYLNFDALTGKSNLDIEHNEERYGWRRLPRPNLDSNFLSNALKTHVRGPDVSSCNTTNAPVFLTTISPVDACRYEPDKFTTAIESLFIPDIKRDMERSIATLQRNIKREEELSRNIPTEDLLLFGEAKEFTSADAFIAKQYNNDKAAVSDPKEMAKEKALLAAKSTNIAQMEDALAEDIPINTADDFGNTLLILTAQQGSKRMCKFLLRRGANINMQNLSGNTALHYCYAYSNIELAEYLKSKVTNFLRFHAFYEFTSKCFEILFLGGRRFDYQCRWFDLL
jgi:hypothetical protein